MQLLEVIVLSPWKTDLLQRLMEFADFTLQAYIPDFEDAKISKHCCEELTKNRKISDIQADAVLAMGHLMTPWTVEELVAMEADVVLVMVITNTVYPENQYRACRALRKLVHLAPSLGDKLAEQLPLGLLRNIMLDPVTAVDKLRPVEVHNLRDWVKKKTERRLAQLAGDLSSMEETSAPQLPT